MHTQSHTLSNTFIPTPTHSHIHLHAHTHKQPPYTLSPSPKLPHIPRLAKSHGLSHTHTQIHTHTHTPKHSRPHTFQDSRLSHLGPLTLKHTHTLANTLCHAHQNSRLSHLGQLTLTHTHIHSQTHSTTHTKTRRLPRFWPASIINGGNSISLVSPQRLIFSEFYNLSLWTIIRVPLSSIQVIQIMSHSSSGIVGSFAGM